MHRRQLVTLLAAALAAPLGACLDSDSDVTAPEAVPIESANFASGLGVNIAGSTKTSTGLYYRDIRVGTGAAVAAGQTVAVRYTGWLSSGQQFDSNVGSGSPFEFVLGRGSVIPGFDQGFAGMRVGGQRQLIIPPNLGYGPSGTQGIPGNAILVFNVEVVSVR